MNGHLGTTCYRWGMQYHFQLLRNHLIRRIWKLVDRQWVNKYTRQTKHHQMTDFRRGSSGKARSFTLLHLVLLELCRGLWHYSILLYIEMKPQKWTLFPRAVIPRQYHSIQCKWFVCVKALRIMIENKMHSKCSNTNCKQKHVIYS